MSNASCKICGSLAERVWHHYPVRKPPHNAPYEATVYHRDPFWGDGDLEEYCGSKCATQAYLNKG
jgi:hypothetical protein